MSVTPNQTKGAADEEAPETAPTAMDSKAMSITIVAFIVFIVTWIGAKVSFAAMPNEVGDTADLDLLQLALFVVAAAAAIVVGRGLKPIQRSVYAVITIAYFVAYALMSIFADSLDGLSAGASILTVIGTVIFVADLAYPLIIAQVLAVTVSRVTPVTGAAKNDGTEVSSAAAGEAEAEDLATEATADDRADNSNDSAETADVAGLDARARRHGKTAATVLFITVAVIFIDWLVRTIPQYMPPDWQESDWGMTLMTWSWADAINAIAAAVGTVAAVFALRAVAESRALPKPDAVVGPKPKQARPKFAHILTFLTVAGGLYFALTSTLITTFFLGDLIGGYPSWKLGLFLFTVGALLLAIVTLDAVTNRRKEPSAREE
jgi:hypothetical protein